MDRAVMPTASTLAFLRQFQDRSSSYLGTALAVQGNTDDAIAAYEQAIEVQAALPRGGSQAYLNQALLIALNDRRDMSDTVLDFATNVALGEAVTPFNPLTALH